MLQGGSCTLIYLVPTFMARANRSLFHSTSSVSIDTGSALNVLRMAAASNIVHLLLCLRRSLLRILNRWSAFRLAPARVLAQLTCLRATLVSRLYLWLKANFRHSSSPKEKENQVARPKTGQEIDKESNQQTPVFPLHETTLPRPYMTTENGDTISLEGVLTSSLYPFANGNIRNSSRSSFRSSDNRSIHSRSPSQSSIRLESPYSQQSVANSAADFQARVAFPGHPYLAYSPSLAGSPKHQPDVPERIGSSSIHIMVTEPESTSQTELQIPSPSPIPYFRSQDRMADSDQHSEYYSTNLENLVVEGFFNPRDRVPTIATNEVNRVVNIGMSINDIACSSTNSFCLERQICPALPVETLRYTKRTKILKRATEMTMEPITLNFSKPVPPQGWLRYAHPEGARYFYHEEKRVYTEAEIYDPEILSHLEHDIQYLVALKTTSTNCFPESGELVINVYRTRDGDMKSEYYCIDHHSRVVFFLETFNAKGMEAWHEVPGVTSAAQLHIELEAQYWYFVQLFPNSLKLSNDIVCELRDIVLHLIGDKMTSPYSTASLSLEDLYKILTLTSELDKNAGCSSFHGSVCLLARNMYIFTHSRFLNSHGESYARIERNFSVYGATLNQRTWFIKAISPILFSVPDAHLGNLQKMWVDETILMSVWEQTLKKMIKEWREVVFFSVLLLNANVAFLSIPTVDAPPLRYRSPAQISCYLSVLADIASIILGLLLVRQNRNKSRQTAIEVGRFLSARNHPLLGLESLAILYSLPYAFLYWGLVSFVVALGFMFFKDSNVPTRSLVGLFGCGLAIAVGWCIFVFWEDEMKMVQLDQPLAYSVLDGNINGNDDKAEESQDDAGSNGDSRSRMTGLGQLWRLSTMFRRRRASTETEKTTIVENEMPEV